MVIELLAIIATVLGLATSFGFAAMQFSSGLNAFTALPAGPLTWMTVIIVLGALTAISAFLGVNKGMKRISELNSVLSIVLVTSVFVFGPTVFILSNMVQTFGGFLAAFPAMSFWTEAETAGTGAPAAIGAVVTSTPTGGPHGPRTRPPPAATSSTTTTAERTSSRSRPLAPAHARASASTGAGSGRPSASPRSSAATKGAYQCAICSVGR